MAEQRRFFDVRITETSQTYRRIPFSVVADWIQEGRLLDEDRVRPAGSSTWQRLADTPLLSSYLPKPVPFRAEDQAEALEPVQHELSWKRPAGDDEEEVDMIPLIDISLVLLIFFMMTAGTLLTASLVKTPEAEYARVIEAGESITVGMIYEAGKAQYFLDNRGADVLSERQLLDEVADRIKSDKGVAEVLLKANPETPVEKMQELTVKLETLGVKRILLGVRDKEGGD